MFYIPQSTLKFMTKKGGKKKMGEEIVMLHRFTCERCGHNWLPKTENRPVCCGKCKSPYWDKPRKNNSSNEKK